MKSFIFVLALSFISFNSHAEVLRLIGSDFDIGVEQTIVTITKSNETDVMQANCTLKIDSKSYPRTIGIGDIFQFESEKIKRHPTKLFTRTEMERELSIISGGVYNSLPKQVNTVAQFQDYVDGISGGALTYNVLPYTTEFTITSVTTTNRYNIECNSTIGYLSIDQLVELIDAGGVFTFEKKL
jgi:hypothetical protein